MKSVNRVSPQIELSENDLPMGTGLGLRILEKIQAKKSFMLFEIVLEKKRILKRFNYTLTFDLREPYKDFGGTTTEEAETFLPQSSQRSATFVLDGEL